MKYLGCLIAVKDMAASKHFYQDILHQTVVMDIGAHVSFEGFSLQQGYAEIVGLSDDSVLEKEHNFQLYFEVDNLDAVFAELSAQPDIKFVHGMKEYPWGQRGIRIYDPDMHIVEITEIFAF